MTLVEHHVNMLKSSAIAAAVMQARGYWTATRKVEIARLGFAPAQQLQTGVGGAHLQRQR